MDKSRTFELVKKTMPGLVPYFHVENITEEFNMDNSEFVKSFEQEVTRASKEMIRAYKAEKETKEV